MPKTDERTVWALARLATVADPDTPDSPGARWLRQVEASAQVLIDDEATGSDDISEQADLVVPVYTHERWTVFVDLCAYSEDISELSGGRISSDSNALTEAAGWALYLVAERLIRALIEAGPVEPCEYPEDRTGEHDHSVCTDAGEVE